MPPKNTHRNTQSNQSLYVLTFSLIAIVLIFLYCISLYCSLKFDYIKPEVQLLIRATICSVKLNSLYPPKFHGDVPPKPQMEEKLRHHQYSGNVIIGKTDC